MSNSGVTIEQAVKLLALRLCHEHGIDPQVSDQGALIVPRWLLEQATKRVNAEIDAGTIWATLAECILMIDTEGSA